ncbi:hypothetical protein SAICODRAFT_5805 [Saitoella complicata NRRL Y-17804]|uniref:uncharacterized protein n=1 Tax=Saitoella complicata (strain BCRC 22490 / CBS 7301 / JCM 7358 / NBRC 10748 / NRRL Y-17804) TaxID=698492 RepID=UPI000867C648|nr:uncharacterized protein SAICODRAFT_5805 [Saitoella complicata NRRL Y-17804]ODQ54601.1 hypothetical protein SAICODRAFT_5805 [Saitoella complicata NRRL Y-17804]
MPRVPEPWETRDCNIDALPVQRHWQMKEDMLNIARANDDKLRTATGLSGHSVPANAACHLLFNLWDGRLPCNTDATCTAADKPDAEELQVAVRPLDDSERERGRGRDPEEAEEDADAAVNSDDASRIDNL